MMSLSRAQKLLMEASVLHAGSQKLATRVQAECLTSKPCSKAAALGGCCPRILRLLCPWRLLPLEFAALETALPLEAAAPEGCCPWRLLGHNDLDTAGLEGRLLTGLYQTASDAQKPLHECSCLAHNGLYLV